MLRRCSSRLLHDDFSAAVGFSSGRYWLDFVEGHKRSARVVVALPKGVGAEWTETGKMATCRFSIILARDLLKIFW